MADGCPHRCIVSMLQGQGGQVDLRVTERLVWEPGFDTVIEGCGGPRSRSGSTGLCGEESEAAGGAPSPALRACLSREGRGIICVSICSAPASALRQRQHLRQHQHLHRRAN